MYIDIRVRVCDKEPVFGPGLITLLEYIKETGSMKEACLRMGMSYSKGWKIVNRAEKTLGYELIIRHHGGTRGGNCILTDKGITLIQRFNLMEDRIRQNAELVFSETFPEYVNN